jgi:hypothetical protein
VSALFFLDFRVAGALGAVAPLPAVRDQNDRAIGEGGPALRALGSAFPHLTFLVHGFNVSRANGVAAYRAFTTRLAGAALPTCFVGVLWPGDVPVLHGLSYPFEMGPADKTADNLAACITSLVRPGALSLVAHSLGCRVALRTLALLDPTQAVDEAILLAGAVDCDTIARSDRYRAGVTRVRRAVVVSSLADHVLEFAFPVGDFIASLFLHPGTLPALGRVGARPTRSEGVPIDVAGVAVGALGVDHGDYFPAGAARPQAERMARLASSALAGGPVSP